MTSKTLVRLLCAAVLLVTFTGCHSAGSGMKKRKSPSDFPAVDSGTPSQSPFAPFPTQ